MLIKMLKYRQKRKLGLNVAECGVKENFGKSEGLKSEIDENDKITSGKASTKLRNAR